MIHMTNAIKSVVGPLPLRPTRHLQVSSGNIIKTITTCSFKPFNLPYGIISQ